jgi:hypothetical protein
MRAVIVTGDVRSKRTTSGFTRVQSTLDAPKAKVEARRAPDRRHGATKHVHHLLWNPPRLSKLAYGLTPGNRQRR